MLLHRSCIELEKVIDNDSVVSTTKADGQWTHAFQQH